MSELKDILINISEEKQTKIIPENVKVGVEAFGVQGNFTSDATATAGDIRLGKTAYSNGEKITGELEVSDYNMKFDITNQTNNKFVIMNNLTEIDFKGMDTTKFNSFINSFANASVLTKVKNLDTSNSVNFEQTFSGCSALVEAPELNTGKATTMYGMFAACRSLVTVPLYDTSTVTKMQVMFSGCTNLSDESLNNILAMCTNAVAYTQTKTLVYIGLTSDQATRCQSLSNYQAFLDAGWITGF